MEIGDIIGYGLLFASVAGMGFGLGAARYYSPGRVAARQRARAIKEQRSRAQHFPAE